ncbi:MAG: tetratricopeptide repeat protein [Candidatus Acidiferrales bacterium]
MANRVIRFAVSVITFTALAAAVGAGAQSPDPARAMELFKQRKWVEAAAAFEQIEAASPGQTDALLYQGKCLVNLERFGDAGTALQAYWSNHPQSEDAAYLLAYVRFREDKPRESLELFTAAARLKTPTADDFKIVSLDYVLLNDYDDAGRYLEECLRRDPENAECLYHLGRVRYQQNRFDDAIAAFEHALRLEPNDVKAENNLGLSYDAENKNEAAIAAYRKAIALDQAASAHTEQPYLNLGMLLSKSNHPGEAVPLLVQAEGIAPSSNKVRYELGKAYFDMGQFAKAQPELEAAVRIDPKSRESHYMLGRVYQRLGKADLAAQEFKITESLIRSNDAGASGMSAAPGPGMP